MRMPLVDRSLTVAFLVVLCLSPARALLHAAQVTFEQATMDLASPDAATRLRAVQMFKEAAYLESASPVATVLADPEDAVQLEAIAAELNIFLAEKIIPRKRIGLVIEKRTPILAEPAFAAGPLALGARRVPLDLLIALRTAARDDNPRVAIEALYAFGALAVDAGGRDRRELLQASGPDLAAMIGVAEPARRFAAVRVLGRLFERRAGDEPIVETVGDAVIVALNDKDRAIRDVAMQTIGLMRYERGIQALSDLFAHYGKGADAEAALDAMARIAHPSSAALLTSQLASGSPALRGIAIEGLARIGDRAVLASIEKASSTERNDGVRRAGEFATALLSDGSADSLVQALAQPKLRDQVRQYLVEIASARPTILARQALDPDPRLRADVVDVMGLARNPVALPVVEPMVNDPDPQVARAAERAVARLQATRM